jgi:hypothetical protein
MAKSTVHSSMVGWVNLLTPEPLNLVLVNREPEQLQKHKIANREPNNLSN